MIWFASLRPGAKCRTAGGRRIGGSFALSPFTVRSTRDAFYGQPEAMQAAFASAEGQAVAADTPNFLDPTRPQILVVNEQHIPLPVARS